MRTSFILTAAFMVSSVFAAPRVVTHTAVVYVTEEAPAVTVKAAPTPCDDDKPKPRKYYHGGVHHAKPQSPKPSYVVVKPSYVVVKPSYVSPTPKSTQPAPKPSQDDLPEDSGNPDAVQPALCLKTHNDLRAQHNAQPLRWSTELQAWAQEAADACQGHSGRQGVGENWASSTGSVPDQEAYIAKMWYGSEVDQYRSSPGAFSMTSGHFTQIVWKGTTELGCGIANCGGQKYVFICQYREPGNMGGEFYKNVQA